MSKTLPLILAFLLAFSSFASVYAISPPSYIPPTRAFQTAFTPDGNVTAESYRGTITFKNGTGIALQSIPANRTIVISSTISSGSSTNENGTNTGTGSAIFKNETSGIWYFRTLQCGTGTSCVQGSDEVTISATTGGGNATFLPDLGDVAINSPTYGHIIQYFNGYWQNKLFKQNNASCDPTTQKIISIDNQTGNATCGTDQTGLSSAIQSINGDTSSAQVISSATTANITITNTGATHTINTGWNIPTWNGTGTFTNKILSGLLNTFSNISESSITNLVSDLLSKQDKSEKNQNYGYAGLGSNGRLNTAQQNGTTEYNTNKAQANGYASLNSNSLVPSAQLGSGSNSSTTYLRGDRTWATLAGSITSVNSQTGPAITIQGTSRNITVSTAANTITINTGDKVVTDSGTQTITNKDLSSSTNTFGFKVNTKSSATRQFLVSFNNATSSGNFGTVTFGINTQTCSANNHVSAINNSTGAVTCSSDALTSAITKLNGQTGSTQTITGTSNHITITNPSNGTTNIDVAFKLNGKTCSAGQHISAFTNSTVSESFTCSADTDTNTAQIVSAGGTSLFKSRDNATQNTIKGLTTTRGVTLTANTNDVQVDTNFKVNTKASATRQFLTSFNNATTSGDFGTTTFGANTITCGAGNHLATFSNSTGAFTCTADSSSGFTKINNVGSGTIKLVQTNSSNTANIKSITTTRGITLTNGTTAADISTNFKVNTKSSATRQFLTSFNNATSSGDFGTTTFGANSVTCSSGQFVSSYSNTTGSYSCSTPNGGLTILAANVTASGAPSADTLIWTIPLTANSGNVITGTLSAVSATSGNAVQVSANVTNLGTRGYCHFITPSTTTADSADNIAMNTVLTGRSTNTAETAWIAAANVPEPISFQCSLLSGATAGNLKVWFNNEIASTSIAIKAGSYYIKTP